jgi:hypothetical protein
LLIYLFWSWASFMLGKKGLLSGNEKDVFIKISVKERL